MRDGQRVVHASISKEFAQQTYLIFSDRRRVVSEPVLVEHEIEAARSAMKRAWCIP
jgi:hypothetical protein